LDVIMQIKCFQKKVVKLGFMFVFLFQLVFGLTSFPIVQSQVAGFYVSGRFLLDANGNNFVMRGINHPHNWYPGETSSFAAIKAKGANTVRVVLSSGYSWPKNSASDVANVINLCKANKLICLLEVHDTTGYGEVDATSLSQAVDYWKEIKSVLDGQEAYVIINLGNEPYGNLNTNGWIADTKNAISEMRNAGFQHMLMVDAPDWGQDWELIMRNNAADVFASDPHQNVVFSIHMYGVYDTNTKVEDYISAFVNAGLPLVVGEFGPLHTDGDPDEDAIMATAQTYGIGYLGWSWSGNSPGGEYLDMVTNFDPMQQTGWGNRIIHGTDGIAETSCEASVYGSNNCSNPTFGDVAFSHPYHDDIEILYANGYTGGCSLTPLLFCPDLVMNRAQAAVFMLRGNFGSGYVPVTPTHFFADNWSGVAWAEGWAESMFLENLSGGCSVSPRLFCPYDQLTNVQAAVFALRLKYGTDYQPPAASGTVFADLTDVNFWGSPWAEQAYAEGLIPACGTSGGKPLFCPNSLVSRGFGASIIVKAKNLTMP
jgi:mannan endo-1,4-beta-mannosidase